MQALLHFERLYNASDDPWQVRDSWYEQRKRAVLLASLPQARYGSAFEPGCGNGELSVHLAPRCDRLLAADGAPSALALARARLAPHAHAEARCLVLPQDWPDGRFDLVVISELAYYFDAAAFDALLRRTAAALAPGATLLLCHYRPGFDDRQQATDAVHDAFGALPGLRHELRHDERAFLLDVWRAPPSPDKESP